ncbi:hypothetical protein HYDPIDRAFT_106189 [Hydnomerulius pinastri MD-312]|nr:hypothetical protein HYDPIDRAFT_106189 [Hydnomerulius pinastri MD-312]
MSYPATHEAFSNEMCQKASKFGLPDSAKDSVGWVTPRSNVPVTVLRRPKYSR